jgi:acyl-CoA thioester hydrolase
MSHGFYWPLRVYYEDTDAGGIVFYANYLKFFERARTEWLRAAGIGQQALAQQEGCLFIVSRTHMDYHAPAKLDDLLEISVEVEKLGKASFSFQQKAWRIERETRVLLCSGSIRVGCVRSDTLRPQALPEKLLQKIRATHPSPT